MARHSLIRSLFSTLALTLLLAGPVRSQDAAGGDCGPVSIASMNWQSAQIIAEIDRLILSEAFGCQVSLVPGSTLTTFRSMNKRGRPDIAPELWVNAVRDEFKQAVTENRLHTALPIPISDLSEGWWVRGTDFARENGLQDIEDILENPALFTDQRESSGQGIFHGCPPGWGCRLANRNLFKAFDMEAKGWRLVEPGSPEEMQTFLQEATEADRPWFGYFWSPTAAVEKHDLMLMPFGIDFAGRENWDQCIVLRTCENPQPSAWVRSEVHTITTAAFRDAQPEAVAYLSSRIFPARVMNRLLERADEDGLTARQAARLFVAEFEPVWRAWLKPDFAEKVAQL